MTKIICDMCGKEIKGKDLKTIYFSFPAAKEVCSNCCSKLEDLFTEECYKNFEKEHHTITNADKFKEVFGFIPHEHCCPFPDENCGTKGCDSDCAHYHFWSREYKEPSEV